MTSQATASLKQVLSFSAQLLIPVVYFLIIFTYFPFHNTFALDFDEGINLLSVQMLQRGFLLYSEIWYDQPPLFNFLLVLVMRVFGTEVCVSRMFVLLLSCGLLWVSFQYLRDLWGWRHAVVGVILILLLPLFARLSVSVMAGLPAIILSAFSMAALTYWHKYRKYYWIYLSAVCMALSVLVKLFTGFLAPIFIVGLLLGEYSRYREKKDVKQLILPSLIWGSIFTALVFLPLYWVVKPNNFDQLLLTHLYAGTANKYQSDPSYRLAAQLRDAAPILALALLGVYYTVRSKNRLAWYPIVWMVAASMILSRYVPVWDHQQLLITIPAAWVAAGGVGEAWSYVHRLLRDHSRLQSRYMISLVTVCVLVYACAARIPTIVPEFESNPNLSSFGLKPTSTEAKFLKKIRLYAPETRWMITDIPMFAFYANLPVPPNLVDFSLKRLETGSLTEEEIIKSIQVYHPEQVLLGRNKLTSVRQYLKKDYQIILKKDLLELYVSKELISSRFLLNSEYQYKFEDEYLW